MSRVNRVNEILESMTSFRKESYQREEILDQLMTLQKELVNATFSEEHAENGTLRIWDVEKHLEQLNQERGNVADEELAAFEEKCKFVCNMIKSEISGRNGEEKAFRALDVIGGKKHIVKNCELTEEEERTELDAVVVTPKGIFIVEVKNTNKDVMIDENGNYYRNGTFMNWDSNIGEKMNVKQKLLRNALAKAGFNKDVKIQNIIVFTTSNRIEVVCRYDYIRTCFLSALPHIINNFRGYSVYSDEDMVAIVEALETARCKEAYPMEMDMAQFKLDFAELMTTLEESPEVHKGNAIEKDPVAKAEKPVADTHYQFRVDKKLVKGIGVASALVAIVGAGVFIAKKVTNRR